MRPSVYRSLISLLVVCLAVLIGTQTFTSSASSKATFKTQLEPTSVEQILKNKFPILGDRLEGKAEFNAAIKTVNGKDISGMTVTPPSLEAVLSRRLKGQEREAILAKARRDGAGKIGQELRAANKPALDSFLPTNYTDPFVVEGSGIRVAIQALDANPTAAVAANGKVTYSNAYNETDLLHSFAPGQSKEYMLLRTPYAPTQFSYEVSELSGNVQIKLVNGEVRFNDEQGKGLTIQKPWLVDANGNRSEEALSWSVNSTNGKQILTLSLNSTGLTYPIVVDPTFTLTGSLITARDTQTANLLTTGPNAGKVLVAGGFILVGGSFSVTNTAELYDPATGTFTATGSMVTARTLHTATTLADGRVLAAAGLGIAGTGIRNAEIYNPTTGTWTATGLLVTARFSQTATLLNNGNVILTGGFNAGGTNVLRTTELYNTTAGTFSAGGQMVTARADHTATLLANGNVLITAGDIVSGGSLVPTRLCEVYNSTANTFAATGQVVRARDYHSSILLPNGMVLTAGGGDNTFFATNTAELYNPTAGTWSSTGSMLGIRAYFPLILLPNGTVMANAGFDDPDFINFGIALKTNEIYNPATGTWSAAAPLNIARGIHTATVLPSGKIMVCGGDDTSVTPLSSAELFASATTSTVTSSVNPSMSGQSVTFTATVASVIPADGTPTGSVQFSIDGSPVGGSMTLGGGGTATFTTSSLAVGVHTVSAVFTATGLFNNSTSNTLSQLVGVATLPTTTTVVASANPSIFGQPVTFTANVKTTTGAMPAPGMVVFAIDGTAFPPVTLVNGVATMQASNLTIGSHQVVVSFLGTPGNPSYVASIGQLSGNQIVSCQSITVSPSTLPTATLGAPYSATFSQSGANGSVTFTQTGSLPPGMTFSNGTISGTPTSDGSYSFTIVAKDANGCMGSRTYTLGVGVTIVISPDSLPDQTVGQSVRLGLTASGGFDPYVFTLTGGALPTGLQLSRAGLISGTATKPGSYAFLVVATDSTGNSSSKIFSINIVAGPPK